jgi:NADH-quinone oxidoreductase subunit M
VGEFMILMGSFQSEVIGRPLLIALGTTGVILAAVYLLWMVYRVFWGPLESEENRTMKDLNMREIALLVPLVVLMVWMGFAPQPFLDRSAPATEMLLETIETKRAAAIDAEATPLVFDGHIFGQAPAER